MSESEFNFPSLNNEPIEPDTDLSFLGKSFFLGRKKGVYLRDLIKAEQLGTTLPIKGVDGTPATVEMSETMLSIKEHGGYVFEAKLIDGVCTLLIENKIGRKKSHNIFPSQLLEYTLDKWGDKIKLVRGSWKISGGSVNTNRYYAEKKKGKSPEEAAALTWTGTTLDNYGFGKVKKVNETDHYIYAFFERNSDTNSRDVD